MSQGAGPGEQQQGEGEAEHHEDGAGLQLAGVDLGHHGAQLAQLLHQTPVVRLQGADPSLQLLVGVRAALDPLLQPLHVLLLPSAAFLSRDLVLDLPLHSLQVLLLMLQAAEEQSSRKSASVQTAAVQRLPW